METGVLGGWDAQIAGDAVRFCETSTAEELRSKLSRRKGGGFEGVCWRIRTLFGVSGARSNASGQACAARGQKRRKRKKKVPRLVTRKELGGRS